MPEGWTEKPLGDLVRPVRRPVEVTPGVEYPLLGVRWYGEGPFLREIGVGGIVKAKKLYRVKRGDFIYNRLFAWKGSFGVIGEDLDGSFVSGEFPLFVTDASALLPNFLSLLMCQPSTWAQIERESTGSTATSRNRWKEERFLEWPVVVPPVAEQRRIIDLVGAADKVSSAGRHHAYAIHQAMVATLIDAYVSLGAPSVGTDDLCEHILGGAWGSDPGIEDTEVWALGPVAFRDDPIDVAREASTRRSLPLKRASSRVLREGDIVLERSGGTEDQPVGRVIRARTDMPSVVPSDFMRLIRVDPARADQEYVFWVLWVRYQRGDTLEFQNKTTNIRNLRIPDYLASPIPLPNLVDQRRLITLAESFQELRRTARLRQAAIERLNAALTTHLLSGSHEIPGSYDELLEQAS